MTFHHEPVSRIISLLGILRALSSPDTTIAQPFPSRPPKVTEKPTTRVGE
jgi:hypothetical protein